jgi:hypothetical protein
MPKGNAGKRRQEQQSDSLRWPKLFANQAVAQSLVQTPGFLAMLDDLQTLRETLEFDVIHNTPTMELTNFHRGQIAVLERMRDLADELHDWQELQR